MLSDLLTLLPIALIGYAVLLKVGAFRHVPNVAALAGGVKGLLASIPLTPPQAEQRYQAKEQARKQERGYVVRRRPSSMLKVRRSRIAVPPVSVPVVPVPAPVMSSAAPRFVPLTEMQQERVRELIVLGWSNNKIYSLLLGSRAERMAEIKAVRHDYDAEQLAKIIAAPHVVVPEPEPIPV